MQKTMPRTNRYRQKEVIKMNANNINQKIDRILEAFELQLDAVLEADNLDDLCEDNDLRHIKKFKYLLIDGDLYIRRKEVK